MGGDTSLRPASFEIKTIINDEYKRTESYASSVSDIKLKVTNSTAETKIKYEVNPLDNWKVELNEDEKTITFTYNFVKYTVILTFNDNNNLYGKRPNPNNIQINATSGNENKTVKIGDKVNSNWKTEENITVSSVNLDLELDDTKEWIFSVTPNTIAGYEVTFNTDEVYKIITITFTCNLKVVKWEIDGRDTTKINGKNNNGDTLQTVNIGDYIIYNKGFNQTYHIGYDGVKSSESDDEIANLTESNWRIIGVSNEQLLIAAIGNTPAISILAGSTENGYIKGYNNGMKVLNDIASKYKIGKYATEARQINVEDINNLIHYFGVHDTYGNNNGGIPKPILFSTNQEGTHTCDGHNNCTCYKIEKKLHDLLFPENCGNYWVNKIYSQEYDDNYVRSGYYAVSKLKVDGLDYATLYGLYAAHLTNWGSEYRQYNVRPVVELKKDIIIYGSGQTREDGSSVYNIKN